MCVGVRTCDWVIFQYVFSPRIQIKKKQFHYHNTTHIYIHKHHVSLSGRESSNGIHSFLCTHYENGLSTKTHKPLLLLYVPMDKKSLDHYRFDCKMPNNYFSQIKFLFETFCSVCSILLCTNVYEYSLEWRRRKRKNARPITMI